MEAADPGAQVDDQPEAQFETQIEAEIQPSIDADIEAQTVGPAESEFLVADEPQEVRSEEEVAACKKQYRDAIDAIDAEMARDYTPERADEYKERLLALTRQLRQC